MPPADFEADVAAVLSSALEHERAGADPGRAFETLGTRIGIGLGRWIGADGWDALLARARSETPADGADQELRTMLTVARILSRLIGPDLALRLLTQASQ